MFISWPDIESFYNLRKSVKKYPHLVGDSSTVTYRAKVKLHGTNAGVRVNKDGTVYAQSRTQTITPFSDNAGFARWVAENQKALSDLSWRACFYFDRDKEEREQSDVVIYGEWCGPGIQKGVAVNNIEEKTFAVFAILHVNTGELMVDPATIVNVFSMTTLDGIKGLKIIPWYSNTPDVNPPVPFQVDIDFNGDESVLEPIMNSINAEIDVIEKCDPWVRAEYGIEGTGEGLVFYAVSPAHEKLIRDLYFKAKGEKHKVVGKTKAAQVEVPVAEGVTEFAEMVLPLPRLEQGVRAVSNGELVFDIKKMGPFLKWIAEDIKKETTEELLASGLDGKVALNACQARARTWFLEQIKNLGA